MTRPTAFSVRFNHSRNICKAPAPPKNNNNAKGKKRSNPNYTSSSQSSKGAHWNFCPFVLFQRAEPFPWGALPWAFLLLGRFLMCKQWKRAMAVSRSTTTLLGLSWWTLSVNYQNGQRFCMHQKLTQPREWLLQQLLKKTTVEISKQQQQQQQKSVTQQTMHRKMGKKSDDVIVRTGL